MIQVSQKHRKIACEWHGGQFSPLYAVCSTGNVHEDSVKYLIEEINSCLAYARENEETAGDIKALTDLLDEVLQYDSFDFIGE